MEGFQRFTAIGTLGMDPELKQVRDNMKVANFSLAINESRKNQSTGEKITNTMWLNVEVWNQTADFVSNYIKKGSNVFIEGKIRIDNVKDEQGNYKSFTKLIADNVKIISSPSNNQNGAQNNGSYVGVSPQMNQNGNSNNFQKNNVNQQPVQQNNVQQGYQQQNFQQQHVQQGYQQQNGFVNQNHPQNNSVEAGVNNYMSNNGGFQIPVDEELPF